jgi:type VI secretion system secreted protein VgrG
MTEKIKRKVVEAGEEVRLKELRKEVRQDINCRINLLNYKSNETIGVVDGNYSVYKLNGVKCNPKMHQNAVQKCTT